MTQASLPFQNLSPEWIMDAIESVGYWSDYRVTPLNSYENRVFQVGIEDSTPLIMKVYRPERWSDEQINEELSTLALLSERRAKVAAPIENESRHLFQFGDYRFSLFNRLIGPSAEPDNLDHLFKIGESIGECHSLTQNLTTTSRPTLSPLERVKQAANTVITSRHVPTSLQQDYQTIINLGLKAFVNDEEAYQSQPQFRIHGDLHCGNTIICDGDVYLVDFDDCRLGIQVEDLWIVMGDQNPAAMSEVIEGYESYCEFDTNQLKLIPLLRFARHVEYQAWLASRWSDPAFPKAFPWFGQQDNWQTHIRQLRELLTDN